MEYPVKDKEKIGLRAGRKINKYKMAKHFNLEISDSNLIFEINQDKVEGSALDVRILISTQGATF